MPRVVAWDTETSGLEWFQRDQRAFITTWSTPDGQDHLAHQDDARAMAAFKSDVARADVLVAHNAPFDCHQTRVSENGFDILSLGKPIVDTVIKAKVAVPERWFAEGDRNGYGLDELSRTYLPVESQKISLAERARELKITLNKTGGYHKLWQADPEFLERYAKQDTRATIELEPILDAKLTSNTRRIWELEQRAQPHVIRAEARGVAVDQAKVEPLHAAYLVKRDVAYDEVVKALGPEALGDPSDPDAKDEPAKLLEALLTAGVPLHRLTQSGETLAVNQPALNEFKNDFPFIQSLVDYRTASKFLRTYVGPMLGREVVHPSFNQFGAWTGRMSCSRPNMQNIPVRGEGASELREMFVPRPGYCFVVSDFDQIELRLLAYYLNSPDFTDRIEAGAQVFQELAATLWGGHEDDYAKSGPKAKLRSDAKNGTYAICYGVGAGKLSDMLDLPPGPPNGPNAWKVQRGYALATDPSYPEGARIARTVKNWLPNYDTLMGNWDSRIKEKVKAVGHVNTIMGRRQPIKPDKAYIGLAGLIQGGAADIFKQALTNVGEAVAHLGATPLLYIHDEIASECPVEHAEECLRLQDAAMEAAYDLRPRLSVSGTIAYNNYSEGK